MALQKTKWWVGQSLGTCPDKDKMGDYPQMLQIRGEICKETTGEWFFVGLNARRQELLAILLTTAVETFKDYCSLSNNFWYWWNQGWFKLIFLRGSLKNLGLLQRATATPPNTILPFPMPRTLAPGAGLGHPWAACGPQAMKCPGQS